MRITRILISTAAITVGATGIVACSDEEPVALTKPEFITQGNAICQAAEDEIVPIFDVVWDEFGESDENDPAAQADQEEIFERFNTAVQASAPIWAEMADDLDALRPPSEDRAVIATMIADLRSSIDEMQDISAAAADGDADAREKMEGDGSSDPFADVNRQAREYGLSVCGEET